MFAVTFIISPARSSCSQTDLQLIRQPKTFHITWVLTNNKMHNGNWKWQSGMLVVEVSLSSFYLTQVLL